MLGKQPTEAAADAAMTAALDERAAWTPAPMLDAQRERRRAGPQP